MADEVRGSVQGSNGERLQVTVGSKTFGLAARDLLPILLLVLMGVGGYLLYTSIEYRIATLLSQHDRIRELLDTQTQTLLHAVADQRTFITEKIQGNRDDLDRQTETLRKYLITHDLNQGREPADRLPLELAPPPSAPR